MRLRKVLYFNTLLGMTLPKEYSNALKLNKGDYVEVSLKDKDTIVIKRHNIPIQKIREDD